MLTIFTATYNREKTLKRLYNSLKNQSFKDFEWLIVDDGSTDNTKQIVDEFISENQVVINYIYQNNSGKMRAFNTGVRHARGSFFICIDSDDYAKEDVLKVIFEDYKTIEDDDSIAGLGYLVEELNSKQIVGSKYPNVDGDLVTTYSDIYYNLGVQGDKQLMFKTSVLLNYPHPVFPDEKFIPEAVVYNRISKQYKIKFLNKIATVVEYMENGYSENYWTFAKKSPLGHQLYYKEMYFYKPTFYNAASYNLYGLLSKQNVFKIIFNHPSKIKSLLTLFPAYIKYLLIKR